MRKLDLNQPVTQPTLPSSIVVQWKYDGEERTTFLLTKRTLEFGRESTSDVCLRVEPVENHANKEASLQISRRHFRLSVDNDAAQIIDLGSASGTSVNSTTLEPSKPFVLQSGEIITIADVLRLSVWIEKESDEIQAVHLRRVDNLPGTEYICLLGQGAIDIGEHTLLRLPLASARQGRVRAIDIEQDHVVRPPALLLAVDGIIHIKRTGNDPVTVNQTELDRNQSVPLPESGVFQVGNSIFTIRTA